MLAAYRAGEFLHRREAAAIASSSSAHVSTTRMRGMGFGLGGLAIRTLKRKLETLSPCQCPLVTEPPFHYLSLEFYTSVLAELLGSKCFETVTANDCQGRLGGGTFVWWQG